MLRFAIFLIFARLFEVSWARMNMWAFLPILEPNLDRPLGHINIRRNPFSNKCSRCWVLIELDFQCHELILCCPLALLVFLLLSLKIRDADQHIPFE